MFTGSKIKSIKAIGIQTVCDITVKDNHSYVANNIVNHNSSQDPNLQNIPRDTTSSDIKTMFIPPKGMLLLQLDYSQAELRVMAAMAGETNMIRWFKEGKDIHLATALSKYHMDNEYQRISDLLDAEDGSEEYITWKKRRKQAKTINFGIIYGQGANKLAESLECTIDEAKVFLNEFFKNFPKIKKFIKKQHSQAHEHAYVRNVFGRKRRLWDIDSDEKWLVAQAERQCTDEKTEALTKTGWKKYNELEVGELILTKNKDTGILEWQPIELLNIYDAPNKMYHLKNNSFDALVTEEHKWLCNVTTKRNTNSFYTTKELYEGKLRLIHRSGDYNEVSYTDLSDDHLRFIGLILTDGNIRYYQDDSKPRYGKPWYVSFTQTKSKGIKYIEEVCKRIGIKYTKKQKGNSYSFKFDITIAKWLDEYIPNKKLTWDFINQLDSNQANLILEGMLIGDGHRDNKAIITGDKEQADLIQALILYTGRYSNINIKDNRGKHYSDKINNKEGYIETKNISYSVTLGNRKYFHSKSTRGETNITEVEDYRGKVWCPTVKNNTWVARRNGKQYITGNSVNAPIQGAASDYALFSSILIWEQAKRGKIKIACPQVYTVHDSLGYYVWPEDVHEVVPKLLEICNNPETKEWFGFQIDDVTMKVDFEVTAENWGVLKTYNPKTDYTKLI